MAPLTWTTLFKEKSDTPFDKVSSSLPELTTPHAYRDGVVWSLTREGLVIGSDALEATKGDPETVRKIWRNFQTSLETWSAVFGVPVELIMATICTESGGDPTEVREEPGYISDEKTPNRVSPGLTHTLISTAREVLGNNDVNRAWLLVPDNAIRAGTGYIARNWKVTHFDPPKVACAYNAGGVYYNDKPQNRWRMRQYPIGTSAHADRFIKWFNDCFRMFDLDKVSPATSFFRLLRER